MTLNCNELPIKNINIDINKNNDNIELLMSDKLNYDNIELQIISFDIDLNSDGDGDGDSDSDFDEDNKIIITNKSTDEIEIDESSTLYQRLKILFIRASPIVVSFFLGIGGGFFNLMYAGSYSINGDASIVLAGISLSNLFANVSFASLVVGLSTAMETLGSQHNGAGNYREVGITLQRSIVLLLSLSPFVIVLWYYCNEIFFLMGIERQVCDVIKYYIRIRIISIPLEVLDRSYEKYLMSIGVTLPCMWANISFNIMILLFGFLFVHIFKFNYKCLAWSWVLSQYLAASIQFIMSLRHAEVIRTLQPFSSDAFKGLFDYFKLGLPGTVMLCSEWWAFEILTIFSSLLGTDSVAAQAIIIQTVTLCFMIPLGIGIGTSSLVGNALGAGKKQLAIQLARLSIKTIVVIQSMVAILLYFFGHYFVGFFTKDENVKAIANSVMPFLSIFTILDALQGVASGTLRGTGKQFIGAVTNVFAFYCVGLPLAWVVCFRLGFGLNGLMMGISLGTTVQIIALLTLIYCYENYIFTSIVSKPSIINESAYSKLDTSSTHGFVSDEIKEEIV
mmetsp:Transcript_13335/g.12084  ORF Transcript_13335/g.12084 Transcript_13335/m.12084 type:complete len:562 (+) Transcript_13335:43-1728(+)